MKTCSMHIASWIPKATNTHSEYINNSYIATATMVAHMPSILRYMYTAHFVSAFRMTLTPTV